MSKQKKKEDSRASYPQSDKHPAVLGFIEILDVLSRPAVETQDGDVGQLRQQCKQIAEKIQVDRDSGAAVDWEQARRLVVDLFRRERDFAVTRFEEFRQMIWVVIQGLRDAFRDEQVADDQVAQHLARLQSAIDSDSIDEMRNHVLAAIVLINRTLEERKVRQQSQLEELGSQLSRMRSELIRAQKALALDPMTRLYNRASFDELMSKTIELSLFSGQSSALLMMDMDHFKLINDSYGHVVGDQAVQYIADCLKQTFPRKSDFVARYGGDEFAVILQDTELHDAEMLAKRLLAKVKEGGIATTAGEWIPVSISIGVSPLQPRDTTERWINRSDQALYQAKRVGRGSVWLASAAN